MGPLCGCPGVAVGALCICAARLLGHIMRVGPLGELARCCWACAVTGPLCECAAMLVAMSAYHPAGRAR